MKNIVAVHENKTEIENRENKIKTWKRSNDSKWEQ